MEIEEFDGIEGIEVDPDTNTTVLDQTFEVPDSKPIRVQISISRRHYRKAKDGNRGELQSALHKFERIRNRGARPGAQSAHEFDGSAGGSARGAVRGGRRRIRVSEELASAEVRGAVRGLPFEHPAADRLFRAGAGRGPRVHLPGPELESQ